MNGPRARVEVAAHVKAVLSARLPASALRRVFGMLDIWSGQAHSVMLPRQQARSRWHMPQLPSSPWLDLGRFKFAEQLRARVGALRAEFIAAPDQIAMHQYGTQGGTLPYIPAHPRGWRELILFSSFGERRERERGFFPEAAKMIAPVLESNRVIAELGFLALEPGTVIPEHTDPWNFMVNIHVPLIAPQECGLQVGTESRSFREGEILAFDTSFLHKAWNHGTRRRVNFYLRTLHPDLSAVEMDAIVMVGTEFAAAGLGPLSD